MRNMFLLLSMIELGFLFIIDLSIVPRMQRFVPDVFVIPRSMQAYLNSQRDRCCRPMLIPPLAERQHQHSCQHKKT